MSKQNLLSGEISLRQRHFSMYAHQKRESLYRLKWFYDRSFFKYSLSKHLSEVPPSVPCDHKTVILSVNYVVIFHKTHTNPSMRTQITQNYWTEALSLLNEVAMSCIPISYGTGTWNREKANKVCSLRKLHPHQPLYCGAGESQSDCIITAGRVLQKGKLRQVNSNVNSSPSADFQLSISRALIDDY